MEPQESGELITDFKVKCGRGSFETASKAQVILALGINSTGATGTTVVGQEEAIVHFADQLIALQTAEYPADFKYLVVGGGGDSMGTATGFNPYVTLEMVRRFGQGCVGSPFFTGANNMAVVGGFTTNVTLAGSAAAVNENFTYLPNGDYYSIPVGGSVTELPQSANVLSGFRKVRCWYGRKSGGGVLTFTVTQNGVALTAKTADTGSGTAGTIGYVDFDATDGLVLNGRPSLVVTDATATSHYLGCYMYLNSGFVPVALGRGGSTYAQALSSNAANLATFCEAMDMRLCFHAVKEEDKDWSDMTDMMDRWAAQHPKCSHIWVGATPSPVPSNNQDPESNAAMKAKALALKMCFVDGQILLRDVDWLQTIGSEVLGWNQSGDGTGPHLSLPARRFIATFIIDKVLLGLNVAGGRFSPMTVEAGATAALSDTRIPATMWAQTLSNVGTTNFTQTSPDMGKLTVNFPSETPGASTGKAGKFMSVGPRLNSRSVYRYRIADGLLVENVNAVIMVGGASQNEIVGLGGTYYGFRIIHGLETISGVPVPWIQFAIRGAGASETVSPKIYHTTATDGAGIYSGGSWISGTENLYWIEFIGMGTSTTKRFRAWHQPTSAASGTDRVGGRRLIADWSGVITLGGSFDASTYFGVVASATPTATGVARAISLSAFSVDPSPRYTSDFIQGDLTY